MRRLPIPLALVLVLGTAGVASPREACPPQRSDPAASALAVPASPAIDSIVRQGMTLIDTREWAQAEALLVPLLQRGDLTSVQQARLHRALGLTFLHRRRRAEAAEHFERALDAALAAGDRNEAGWARRWTATLHYADGRHEAATALWNAARDDFVAAGDTAGEFEVLDDIAVGITGLGKRPYSERCFAIARERGDPLLEARARRRWGQGLLDAALPGPALLELQRAVMLMRGLPSGRPYLADALAVLAWALRAHGSNDRTLPVHREAIRLARAAGDLDGQIWNYFGLGIALAELGRYEEADRMLARGREAAGRSGSLTTIRVLSESEGWLALKKGEWARAARALEESVARPGVELTVMPLVNLSEAYRRLGRADAALAAATRAVEVARRLGLADNELRALTAVAEAREAQGNLHEAEAALGTVLDRLEAYRASLAPADFLKQGFTDRFTVAYGVMVRLLMTQGRAGDALVAAERVRARAFADLLVARRIREHEQSDVGRWLLGAGGDEAPSLVQDSPISVASLDEAGFVALARRLSTTIVAYWIHPSGSYAWVVGTDGAVRGARLPVDPGRLRDTIRRAVDVPPVVELPGAGGTASPPVSAHRGYRTLYTELWAPIASWVPQSGGARVTIIPHGPLFACPFAALRDPRGRYLIERHALHYAGSGAVLREALKRQSVEAPDRNRSLLVADPRSASGGPTEDGPALPGARREARAIEQALGMPSDRLVGEKASESAVRSLLPKARVVHFGTHAVVTDSDPLGSHLALGGAREADAARDGRLMASEVATMALSADLVVLGACRSARGPVSSDGIAGLTRSFMAAGAPSVVATLWEVADEPTARLMTRFYRAYASHRAKDEALRAAQLAVIADLRRGRIKTTIGPTAVTYPEHPWLWAAPVLVGAP